MIRMVIIGPGCDDNVRPPLANFADDLFANLQGRQELTVVIIEHLVFDTDASPSFHCFFTAALGEVLSVLRLMPDVPVG